MVNSCHGVPVIGVMPSFVKFGTRNRQIAYGDKITRITVTPRRKSRDFGIDDESSRHNAIKAGMAKRK